eukprot:snap_masked-scaffold_40-processed-gene-2.40-mRNA-1 protein AED:1.00 eAED:1.00 QI:0/0/0/0/1/1/3/0/73
MGYLYPFKYKYNKKATMFVSCFTADKDNRFTLTLECSSKELQYSLLDAGYSRFLFDSSQVPTAREQSAIDLDS